MITYSLQLLIRQADTVLHAHLVANAAVLAQDGDALDLDTVLDDAGGVAADRGRGTLDTSPGTDAAAPADDGVEDTRIVLDLGVLEHNALLDTGTSANGDTGSDANVGAELGGRVDVGGRVDEDGGHDVGAGLSELFAAGLPSLLQVECVGGDGRASRLDLSPEVLGLVNKELLAIGHVTENVLLQTDNLVLLAFLVVLVTTLEYVAVLKVVGGGVGDQARRAVGTALDGRLDGGEDGFGGEEVDTAVDEVADVGFGFLDVMQDTAGVGVGDDATEVGGGIVADTGAQDDGLGILLVEELQHIVEGERAADIGVEDEQALGAALENDVAEVVETASGAEGLVLAQVLDGDGGELLGRVLDEVAENRFIVVSDNVDLLDLLVGDAVNGGEAVPDDGVAGNFEERLGDVKRERAETGSSRRATDLEQRAVSKSVLTCKPWSERIPR